MWILHVADEPAHHDRHPQLKIHEQKLMEKVPVMRAAIPKTMPPRASVERDCIGAIINQLQPGAARARLINYY